jgi:hypothetical protein
MGISFLAPYLLGGAALVAVPIALHLLMRRQPVPHAFPALRFLQEQRIANRRRLQLRHLLLLLLRIAAILLFVAALARPTLRGAGWLADGEGPVAAVLVFDTSPRMLLRHANRTRLAEAKQLAAGLLDRLPKGSRLAVIDTAGRAAAFSPSIEAAKVKIERLEAATPVDGVGRAVDEGLRLLAESGQQRRELYIFSDLTTGGFPRGEPLAERLAAHEEVSAMVIDVGVEATSNFAIDSLRLAGERVAVGRPLELFVTRSRIGGEASRPLAVEVLDDDGSYSRRAARPVNWSEEGCEPTLFAINGLAPGTRQGRVVIVGADDLDADNSRGFTVEVGPRPKVLVVASAPAADRGRFVAQAIAPAALSRAGKGRFDCELTGIEGLESPAGLGGYSGIVLVDPPRLSDQLWDRLEAWVAEGRGLVVWLGPSAGSSFNTAASRRVLGGDVVRVWRDETGENCLAPQQLEHPLLAAFRQVGDAVPWQDFPVYRHWEFRPQPAEAGEAADPAAGREAVPIAAFRDGMPAILERRLDRGTVIVFTTAASQPANDPELWTRLAVGFEPWPFVILANESLLYAIDTRETRNITAGRPAVVRVGSQSAAAEEVFVTTPSGDVFPAAIDSRRRTVTVSATRQPGNYTLRSGGSGGFRGGFTANLDAASTDIRRLEPEAVEELLGERVRIARTDREIVRDINLGRVGTELFGWLIVLVAVVMAGDWMVANRFYAAREDIGGNGEE